MHSRLRWALAAGASALVIAGGAAAVRAGAR
jgi:hypothetical protein